jgi:hypothetical protein
MFKGLVRHVRRQPVAFVALFFALSSGAVAASDVIHVGDPAGGDLTGTYPNPTIGTGKVTNDKLANPSLTITPGTGLVGGGSIALGGTGGLSVDPAVVQSRVTGTCNSGSTISSVNQDGTVTCQDSGPPSAYVADVSNNGYGIVVQPGTTATLAYFGFPKPGRYELSAHLSENGPTGGDGNVSCGFTGGTFFGRPSTTVLPGGGIVPVNVEVIASVDEQNVVGTQQVQLACTVPGSYQGGAAFLGYADSIEVR